MKKRIEDITPKQIEEAQQIVRFVVNMQTQPANPILGLRIIAAILLLDPQKRIKKEFLGLHTALNNGVEAELFDALNNGLNTELSTRLDNALNTGLHTALIDGLLDGRYAAGLNDGLREGLSDGLDEALADRLNDGLSDGLLDGLDRGLIDGLVAGLRDGLSAGLRDGLRDGLFDRLSAGLNAGLSDGLRAGLRDGLFEGLRDGLDAGLHTELYDGLSAGLDAGLNNGVEAELDAGVYDGLHEGLNNGVETELRTGLDAGLNANKNQKISLLYCGIWRSWWFARYLIAAQWGVKLDMTKLGLLYGFCRFCPLVGYVEIEDKIKLLVLPKPHKVRLKETGLTRGAISLPIFELHGDGIPSVEYPGINLYHFHNLKIPERMGKTPSKEWKAEWLLDETNAEIKRLLIQTIGYKRIAEDLHAKTLDTYYATPGGLYELVEIPASIDVERTLLCKMSCPSTGAPYMIRVPPDISKAYDAITWIRHGITPEQFICQH